MRQVSLIFAGLAMMSVLQGSAQQIPVAPVQDFIEPTSTSSWLVLKENSTANNRNFFSVFGPSLGLTQLDELRLESEVVSDNGYTHSKFNLYHNNVPIENGNFILHDFEGKTKIANGFLPVGITTPTIPSVSSSSALSIVKSLYPGTAIYNLVLNAQDVFEQEEPVGKLLLHNTYLSDDFKTYTYKLVYRFSFSTSDGESEIVYVDAITGAIVSKRSGLDECFHSDEHGSDSTPVDYTVTAGVAGDCVSGNVSTLFYGNQTIATKETLTRFILEDECRRIYTFNESGGKWGDPNNNWVNNYQERAAATAHWGLQRSYDYMKSKIGKNGWDDNNAPVRVSTNKNAATGFDRGNRQIQFSKASYDPRANQDWVCIDVVAHEYAHGFVYAIAGLDLIGGPSNKYHNEPQAINEAIADMYAATVENYVLGGSANFRMGEEIATNGEIRDLSNPLKHNLASTYRSPTGGWRDNFSQMDGTIRYNNGGILTYWFYMLSNFIPDGTAGVNGNGDKYRVRPFGMDKVMKLVYEALYYLHPASTMSDFASAVATEARIRYGVCSFEYLMVIKGFAAIGINSISENYSYNYRFVQPDDCKTDALFALPFAAHAVNKIYLDCDFSQVTRRLVFSAGNEIIMGPNFIGKPGLTASLAKSCLNEIDLDPGDRIVIRDPSFDLKPDAGISVSSLSEGTLSEQLKVFPNPSATGTFELTGIRETANFEVADSQGRIILTGYTIPGTNFIDISSFGRGVFNLKMLTSKGPVNFRIIAL